MKLLPSLLLAVAMFISMRAEALSLETVLWKLGNPPLNEQELARIEKGLAKFNKNPHALVADNSSQPKLSFSYFCVGGKAALVAIGVEGFKCINTSGNTISITNMDRAPFVGLLTDSYVGLNAGISVMTGVAHYSCVQGSCDIGGAYDPDRDYYYRRQGQSGKGGTLSGAFGLYGAHVGYYVKDENHLALVMYQAGLSVEAAFSKIYVAAERD